MKYSAPLLSLIAIVPVAHGIAFRGPVPTATSPMRALYGAGPKPTKQPSVVELRKRQQGYGSDICGWADGDIDSALTCNSGRTCMLYTSASVGMVGCCTGSDTQNCGWVKSCVDYNDYIVGNCDADCLFNSFVRKCTDVASPYCATWTYPSDGIMDYECRAYSTNLFNTLLQSASDILSNEEISIVLPTISGNAVTGMDDVITTNLWISNVPTSSYGGIIRNTDIIISNADLKENKTLAIGVKAGIAVAGLFVLFAIGVGIMFFLKKKKKQDQIAANAQIIAQAQFPSQPPPPQQQQQYMAQPPPQQHQSPPPPSMQMQQGPFAPPFSPQSPQSLHSSVSGYFPLPDKKANIQSQVHEYAQTPISSPSTPGPGYVQPQYGTPPPMTGYGRRPAGDVHEVEANNMPPQMANNNMPQMAEHQRRPDQAYEVDAISVPHGPAGSGPLYELGQGR